MELNSDISRQSSCMVVYEMRTLVLSQTITSSGPWTSSGSTTYSDYYMNPSSVQSCIYISHSCSAQIQKTYLLTETAKSTKHAVIRNHHNFRTMYSMVVCETSFAQWSIAPCKEYLTKSIWTFSMHGSM
jgi:hypothetical protein